MNPLDIVRFLAIVLITNSHLDQLYPWPAAATGGALGNALFFMLSGYGLALSYEKNPQTNFFHWFWRRITRIYPAIWIVVILFQLILLQNWKQWQILDYLKAFIYPTHFWFISAIMLFYILIYVIFRLNWIRHIPYIILALFIPYFYFYYTMLDLSVFSVENGSLFKWIFYFQVILLGVWLSAVKKPFIKPGFTQVLLFLGFFFGYFGLKFILDRFQLLAYQFNVQLITLPLIIFTLHAAHWEPIIETLKQQKWLTSFIHHLASIALEIYLVQLYLYRSPWVMQLAFPLNILLFIVLVIAVASAVNALTQSLQKYLGRTS